MSRVLKISFCVGVYNEEDVVISAAKKIHDNLDAILGKGNYEILFIENGSTDKTRGKLKKIRIKNFRAIIVDGKGFGLVGRVALKKAKYEHVVITGVDLPFGFGDLKKALKLLFTY